MIKIPSDMIEGAVFKTVNCGSLEIVEYINRKNVIIRFTDTGFTNKVDSSQIRSGKVKDYMHPISYGIGYMGAGRFKSRVGSVRTKEYTTWRSMMQRCYCNKHAKRCPSYQGCLVDERWHNFQIFAEWMSKQDHKGKQLDKDILSKSNVGKLYSPELCIFASAMENSAMANAKVYRYKSEKGLITNVYNLAEFCRLNNLTHSAMCRVNSKYAKSHKGWTKA